MVGSARKVRRWALGGGAGARSEVSRSNTGGIAVVEAQTMFPDSPTPAPRTEGTGGAARDEVVASTCGGSGKNMSDGIFSFFCRRVCTVLCDGAGGPMVPRPPNDERGRRTRGGGGGGAVARHEATEAARGRPTVADYRLARTVGTRTTGARARVHGACFPGGSDTPTRWRSFRPRGRLFSRVGDPRWRPGAAGLRGRGPGEGGKGPNGPLEAEWCVEESPMCGRPGCWWIWGY